MRRGLARVALDRFALFGYQPVIPPAFELAAVVEQGLGPLSAGDVLRFIEPETGEVAVFRPDATPQVARMVATRLRDYPLPCRLSYEGTVVRRRLGRAKKHRQIAQVGVELCGVSDPTGDLELLEVAADALRAVGLEHFAIDIADAGIVRGLLVGEPAPSVEGVRLALSQKDAAMLAEFTSSLQYGEAIRELPHLHGDRSALLETLRVLRGTPSFADAQRLLALFDAASERGLAGVLRADAGDVLDIAYYTGLIFSVYAHGPGRALGGGGRYDALLSQFGVPMPAVGFGLELDALALALQSASPTGRTPAVVAGIVVVGGAGDERVRALRGRGIASVKAPSREAALTYARAWRYALVWDEAFVDARSGATVSVSPSVDTAELALAGVGAATPILTRSMS